MARGKVVNDKRPEAWTLPPGGLQGPGIGWVSAVQPRRQLSIILVDAKVSCGFPSPADDYLDNPLDFNELLVANPSATFCVRVTGDSMAPLLLPDDLAVVDRSINPVDRHIVVALLDGSFTIKRYRIKAGRVWLEPENPQHQTIYLADGCAFEVWGVVWRAVRLF